MPITDINHRARTLGRIRAGEYDEEANRPTSRDTWRLTSPHRHLVEAAAGLYGGNPEPLDRKDTDDRWQVTTDTTELDVVFPPQDAAGDQWYEAYTAAGLQARCDGTVIVDGAYLTKYEGTQFPPPCVCDPSKRRCKPTTRLNIILPDLPDLGVWRLTTRSIYAAAEMPTQLAFLFRRTDFPAAVLALDHRSNKTPDGVVRYTVPIIRIRDTLTSILAGEGQPPPALAGTADGDGASTLADPPPRLDAPPPSPMPAEVSPETSPTPSRLDIAVATLAKYLDDHHPYQLINTAEGLITFITEIHALGTDAKVWDRTLDDLATERLKAFRGHADALDVAGDTFAARSKAVDIGELKAFATRLWMEASTKVNA